jgi:hypothetical protein
MMIGNGNGKAALLTITWATIARRDNSMRALGTGSPEPGEPECLTLLPIPNSTYNKSVKANHTAAGGGASRRARFAIVVY